MGCTASKTATQAPQQKEQQKSRKSEAGPTLLPRPGTKEEVAVTQAALAASSERSSRNGGAGPDEAKATSAAEAVAQPVDAQLLKSAAAAQAWVERREEEHRAELALKAGAMALQDEAAGAADAAQPEEACHSPTAPAVRPSASLGSSVPSAAPLGGPMASTESPRVSLPVAAMAVAASPAGPPVALAPALASPEASPHSSRASPQGPLPVPADDQEASPTASPAPPGPRPAEEEAAEEEPPQVAATPGVEAEEPQTEGEPGRCVRIRLGSMEFSTGTGIQLPPLLESSGLRLAVQLGPNAPVRWMPGAPMTQAQQLLKYSRQVSEEGQFSMRVHADFDEEIDVPLPTDESAQQFCVDIWLEKRTLAEMLDGMLSSFGLGADLPEYDRTWLGRAVCRMPPQDQDAMPQPCPVTASAGVSGPLPRTLSVGVEWVAPTNSLAEAKNVVDVANKTSDEIVDV